MAAGTSVAGTTGRGPSSRPNSFLGRSSPFRCSTTEYPHRPGGGGGVKPLRNGSHTGDSGGKIVARRNERSSSGRNLTGRGGRSAEASIARIADKEESSKGGD